MSDFFSSFWGVFITAITVLGIAFCLWLLYTQRRYLGKEVDNSQETGHVWDGDMTELNNPVPRWWTVFYILLCVFGVGYLVLYPGLGTFPGVLNYSTAESVKQAQSELAEQIRPVYARFDAMSIPEVAKDPQAREIGQRLFLNACAQCHGSDGKGSPDFPNLTDKDWLYGGAPEQITHSIAKGRHGIMPPMAAQVSATEAAAIAQYVRSLSGLAANPLQVVPGKRGFETYCVACHGVDGKGNQALGAPNLTDDVWLNSSSASAIVSAILNGRNNQMPAQANVLTPEQIRMLTAYVWGFSNN